LDIELQAAEEAISNFEQHGGDYKQQNFEYEKKIHSLHDELGQAESDRQQLENAFEQWKESKELEVQELQNKLTGVIVSNKECTQVYEQLHADCTSLKADRETALEKNAELTAEVQELQNKLDGAIVSYKERVGELCADCTSLKADRETALEKNAELTAEVQELQNKLDGAIVSYKERVEELCADCTSLKADKETALEKNAELTADIATLRAENGALVAQKEKQNNTLDLIKNQLESVHKEVRAADEDRIKASRKAGDLDNHIRSLREEIRLAEEAKQKASLAADATQHDLMKATKRLDDMLVYTQKLKADHEERELFLKSNMDSQMLSMNEVIQSLQRQVKSIESEKEENRTMYKNDISLQQEVSLFLLHPLSCKFACLTYIFFYIELQEIQKLQTNHLDALKKIDSLSDLVSTLKGTLAIEKENAQILLSQFKTSENDRKAYMKQKEELEIEVASRLKSESALFERIHNLEGVESELASRITSENSKAERIHHLEMELEDMHSKINAKEDELDNLSARMMENANTHNAELKELKSKIDEGNRTHTAMHERIRSMESHTASLQQEFRRTLNKAEEEASKLRVILKEAKGKLKQLHDQNEEMKRGNDDAVQNLQQMLNDAVRCRTNTDASLQESLQLLEQQKRIDIKRKGEISKLEQTVEILKSKERYLESYVASLKKQTRRG
jgi:chromosome segregation ATPase